MKKISEKARVFLTYYYNGEKEGKYYLIGLGSQHYRNTAAGAFFRLYPDCIQILEYGNDAPRGGKTGDFVRVVFTDEFYKKFGPAIQEINEAVENAARREKERQKFYAENHDKQLDAWEKMLRDNPERRERYQLKVKTSPSNSSRSGNWRNWLRMKAVKHVAGGKYENLCLSAPELAETLYKVTCDTERK